MSVRVAQVVCDESRTCACERQHDRQALWLARSGSTNVRIRIRVVSAKHERPVALLLSVGYGGFMHGGGGTLSAREGSGGG